MNRRIHSVTRFQSGQEYACGRLLSAPDSPPVCAEATVLGWGVMDSFNTLERPPLPPARRPLYRSVCFRRPEPRYAQMWGSPARARADLRRAAMHVQPFDKCMAELTRLRAWQVRR
jgi:hypothetical protein